MTYSVELFICMIVGLVIGHGIFNTGHDFSKLTLLFIKYMKCNKQSKCYSAKGKFYDNFGVNVTPFCMSLYNFKVISGCLILACVPSSVDD